VPVEQQDYIDELVATMGDGAPPELDVVCLAEGYIAAIGNSALNQAEVTPEQLADMDSLAALGIEIDASSRDELLAVTHLCMDFKEFADQAFVGFDLGIPETLKECVVSSIADLMAGSVVDDLIDLSGEQLGPTDALSLGRACVQQGAVTAAGADTRWLDGADEFTSSLAAQFAASSYEATAGGLLDNEAECFAASVVGILGDQRLSESEATAGVLGLYLRTLAPPEDLPLTLNDEDVDSLTETYGGCVDLLRIRTEATTAGLAGFGFDDTELEAFADCVLAQIDDVALDTEIWLGFRYGSAIVGRPEYEAIIAHSFNVGAACSPA